jgi:ABC-type Zn uptake system ZnuABC Zn-binding protein ZnuA
MSPRPARAAERKKSRPGGRRYSKSLRIAFAALAFLAVSPAARAELLVVTTTPDLASLAEAVAGAGVRVASLVPPGADAEAYEPRPGDLLKLRGATVLVRVGLGYDDWVEKLVAQAGHASLARGGAGSVDASSGVPLLEVQGRSVERAAGGHAHGLANPHYWLDPENAVTITAAIAEGIARVAPEEGSRVAANRERFLAALAERLALWRARLARHEGAAVVAYHNAWPYLARRFRLNIIAVIEPKEGIAPTPARLLRIAATMREAQARAILVEPTTPGEAVATLASRTGARVAVLAASVGGLPAAGDYLALFDHDIAVLAAALEGGPS